MVEKEYKIGHLLRSGITGFVAGCPIVDQEIPRFGELVSAPMGEKDRIYGIVYEISITDDGLVRQIINTSAPLDPTVIADNRTNRTVPMEISVLAAGYSRGGAIRHLLPPRAPLSLDILTQCSDAELVQFTGAGFGYLRHLLRNPDLPVAELIAAHVEQTAAAHAAAGNSAWRQRVSQELIRLLRDDYEMLMRVLSALSDAMPPSLSLRAQRSNLPHYEQPTHIRHCEQGKAISLIVMQMTKDYQAFVYIMTNRYKTVLYTGVTNDLARRITDHKQNNGKTFTGRYLVNKLVYYEMTESITDAIEREKQLKGGSRKRKVELIETLNPQWNDLYDEVLAS